MRFPFSLTRTMTAYLLRKKLAGEKQFPMVLMLEPSHCCNLACSGCGRIREYSTHLSKKLSVDQCLDAIDECGAPIVSICGGEPLVYPHIKQLIQETLARGKHIYLCTNGLLLEEKVAELPKSKRLLINVHVDGMEATHDRIVERVGAFAAASRGIRAAKEAGFSVCTNTTIYKQTQMSEIAVLFEYLTELCVDGLMISPAYGYQAVENANPDAATDIFMTRSEINEKFAGARRLLQRFRLSTSPIYLDFLSGYRDLQCAAWANPTYNVLGWRGPCYLVADNHYPTYRRLVEATDWGSLGPGRDPRCEHCLVHCGFEPAAVLAAHHSLRDVLRMALWQMT
jgi:hopanoid biosynthesis associated radical SAM protein HpnH